MSELTLKIKPLYEDSIVPKYQHITDSGMDLCAHESVGIISGQRILVRTGISIQLPPNTEAQVRPRSGLALKQGVTVLNAPGTVDEGYTGEIGVILINLSEEWVKINKGDRIAQLVIAPVLRPTIEIVSELETSDRGAKGFGSTGVGVATV